MADVRIRMAVGSGAGYPVHASRPDAQAKITSSASSQVMGATASGGDFLTIRSIGGAIAFDIAAAPVAVATSGDIVMNGETVTLGPLREGDRVAVIDVA